MYSGSLERGLGVVGDVSVGVEASGCTSNAVLKVAMDAPVIGGLSRSISIALNDDFGGSTTGLLASSDTCLALNGFLTSDATFMTTSNSAASSALGSR